MKGDSVVSKYEYGVKKHGRTMKGDSVVSKYEYGVK